MMLPLGEIPSRLASVFQRTPQGPTHLTPIIDRRFRLNGNVLSVEQLSGSLSVPTRVAHLTLDRPISIGRRGNRVRTAEIVVKYLPESDTPPAREALMAQEREAEAYRYPWQDAMGHRMVPATVKRVRNNHGQNVPVIVMPRVEGTKNLRQGLADGTFTLDHALEIQGEVLERTVAALQRRQIRSQRMREKMELVSMKRLERETIWKDMEDAISAIEGFFPLQIPQGKLRDTELVFAEKDQNTGETQWVSYGSLNRLSQRMSDFLEQEPVLIAEGVDHDTSMKNAEVYVDCPPDHVRLDKGYRARRRRLFARILRRPGEAVDGSEAIFYAGKAVTLNSLQTLGEVGVKYIEGEDGRGQLYIDATALQVSPVAEEFEAIMRLRWPSISNRLEDPQLAQRLEGWGAMSNFYEFVYAGKRVIETLDDGAKRSRPDTGFLMLQRMGQTLARHDLLEQGFLSGQIQGQYASKPIIV